MLCGIAAVRPVLQLATALWVLEALKLSIAERGLYRPALMLPAYSTRPIAVRQYQDSLRLRIGCRYASPFAGYHLFFIKMIPFTLLPST